MDLELEYNNRARVPGHPAIIEGWARDAAAFREGARCELGLAYGAGERERLDLFFPEAEGEGPLGLFIHGGYWQGLDRSFFSHMARGVGAHGLTVAVAGYDLCPQVPLSRIVDEMREACRFLWRRFQRPILPFGHSAGGHLTAMLMATRFEGGVPADLVRSGMAVSGLFELEPLVGTSINQALRLDAAEARRLSPFLLPAPRGRRLVAAVGGAESSEFLRQSRTIAEHWGEAGVETRFREVPGADHFTVIGGLADPGDGLVADLLWLADGTRIPGSG